MSAIRGRRLGRKPWHFSTGGQARREASSWPRGRRRDGRARVGAIEGGAADPWPPPTPCMGGKGSAALASAPDC